MRHPKLFARIVALLIVLSVVGSFFFFVVSDPPPEIATTPLHIGVMPAVDSAPIWWAQQYGIFERFGLNVTVELFTNAATQQSALQAGQIDALMASLVEAVANRENDPNYGSITMSTDGIFYAVASPKYDGKKQVRVGLMEISVTNYVSDLILNDYRVEKIFINEIPVRMQMLGTGEIDLAVLPEPMASNAEFKGMQKLDLHTDGEDMMNAIVFRPRAIAEKTEAIHRFHLAYAEAVEEMQGQEEVVRQLLVAKIGLDPEVASLIDLPTFLPPRAPSEGHVRNAQKWMSDLIGRELKLQYSDFVDRQFAAPFSKAQ